MGWCRSWCHLCVILLFCNFLNRIEVCAILPVILKGTLQYVLPSAAFTFSPFFLAHKTQVTQAWSLWLYCFVSSAVGSGMFRICTSTSMLFKRGRVFKRSVKCSGSSVLVDPFKQPVTTTLLVWMTHTLTEHSCLLASLVSSSELKMAAGQS